jgi:hypothetical protein
MEEIGLHPLGVIAGNLFTNTALGRMILMKMNGDHRKSKNIGYGQHIGGMLEQIQ